MSLVRIRLLMGLVRRGGMLVRLAQGSVVLGLGELFLLVAEVRRGHILEALARGGWAGMERGGV